MTPGNWKQIEKIYYSVIASPIAKRAATLDELCSDDQGVREQVKSLLDAREDAGDFLSGGDLKSHIVGLFAESSLVGHVVGCYRVLSPAGAGGMGDVYLALDTRLDRQVALKILPPSFTARAECVARFRDEAKLASALNHPNIMTIYDIGEFGHSS